MIKEADFWQFALRQYARDEVKALCLQLQDEAEVRVTVWLWLWWRATSGKPCSRDLLQQALAYTDTWHLGVVAPLRDIRKKLNKFSNTNLEVETRKAILSAELIAERHEMNDLAHWQAEVVAPTDHWLLVVAEHYRLAEGLVKKMHEITHAN